MPVAHPRVLVVERASPATRRLIDHLRASGLGVAWARDATGARRALEGAPIDGLIAPLGAGRRDGLALFRLARDQHPAIAAVLIAAPAAARRAAEAVREGACDVLDHPVDPDRLAAVLVRGIARQRALARLAGLEARPGAILGDDPFTGRSRAIARVRDQVRHLATTHAPVLVEGEVGTGKGLAARAIHEQSPRRAGPWVAFDLGAGEEERIELELFGSEPAAGERPGRLERADGGTLFLDQIGAAPAGVQIRLLRFLQDRIFERIGGRATLRADVRLITATDRDLEPLAKEGRFREDLLRRLGMVRIVMPPLRERREDIPLLADRFLRELSRGHRRRARGITRGVLERLQRHAWPGNVRELRDTIESMAVTATGGRPLALGDLPPALRGRAGEREPTEIAPGMTVDEAERLLIVATLAHVGGDKPRAAAMLGIGLRTLYRKIEGYRIR